MRGSTARWWSRSLPLVLSMAGVVAAHAQATVTIRSTPSCPGCRLDLVRVATLGSIDDPAGFASNVEVDHDSRGRYIVGASADRTQFMLYDGRGRLLRTVGRRGEGPGEYRGISRVLSGPGDSIHVVDQALARLTVLSPEIRLVRTVSLPLSPARSVILRPDRLLVHARVSSMALAGLPLHLIGPDGRIQRSFGAADLEIRPGQEARRVRVIGRSGNDAAWSAYVDRYRLERWGIDGRLELAIERDADWYRPWNAYAAQRLDERPPRPQTRGVWQAPNGLLYVAIRVADVHWKRSDEARALQAARERPQLSRTEWSDYADTMIEVIDVQRGVLVASVRVPQALDGFTRDGMLYGMREAASGVEVIDVWRVQLHGP